MWASELRSFHFSHDHGESTLVSRVRQDLVEERNFLKFGESEREREREREREVKREKVEKEKNETRIDDVATLYNHWIRSMVDIRTIAPVQYLDVNLVASSFDPKIWVCVSEDFFFLRIVCQKTLMF